MKRFLVSSICCGVVTLSAQAQQLAQRGLPFMKDQDQRIMKVQSDALYQAIRPLSEKLGEHAVNVYSSGRMVGRGTIVAGGIVTKWSEIGPKSYQIVVIGHDGVKRRAFVKAVYQEYDLAILEYGEGLSPVKLANAETPAVGSFLLAVGPAKDSHGFGVVSVEPRSLRESDRAYLGVRMGDVLKGKGVLLEWVQPRGAAARAGLGRGDVVTHIDDFKVTGIHEMGNVLQKKSPGDTAVVRFRRGDRSFAVDVRLGARPEMDKAESRRMQQMKNMGSSNNRVAEGFPDVLQSDMHVKNSDAGSPVFDMDGNFVGVIVAKASRIKTYIIPAKNLEALLKTEPDMVADAETLKRFKAQLEEPEQSPAVRAELRKLRAQMRRIERRIFELESE